MENRAVFYLETNTAQGYEPIFHRTYTPFSNSRTYIIRGASSRIRSEFIKGLSEELFKEGYSCEKIISSFDENITEGSIFPELNLNIFDGGRSNMPDPAFDCTEYIVNMGRVCDRKKLFSMRNEIAKNYIRYRDNNRKCIKFLNAARSMQEDTARVMGDCLSAEKLEKFVSRFLQKEFGTISDKAGKVTYRYLSAVTPQGIETRFDTVKNMCAGIYVLEDKTGVVSPAFMNQLKDGAVLCGYEVIVCLDPLDGKTPEHLIIPELSLGIVLSDGIHKWQYDCTKKINAVRFADREIVKSHKGRAKFNGEAVEELTRQASVHMQSVKDALKNIDDIYDECCDKEKIPEIIKSVKKEIFI